MEIKKSPHADLERGRTQRLLVGVLAALSLVLAIVQWNMPDERVGLADTVLPDKPVETELPPVRLERRVTVFPSSLPADHGQVAADRVEVVDDAADVREAIRQEVLSESLPDDLPEEVERLGNVTAAAEEVLADSLDRLPVYPGGDAACMRFLSRNIRYPSLAASRKITGRVLVQFVVEKDGKLTGIRVQEGVNPMLDREALRVVSLMPAWTPGRVGGRLSRFLYVLPVDFRLK